MNYSSLLPVVAFTQGVFYLLAGIWPLIHITSFVAVTGPKTDLWLVKTVGVLVTIIGMVVLSALRSHRITGEIVLLAVASALGLAGIDIVYTLSGTISLIYLADAVLEIGLAIGWGLGWSRR
jgi:hypothetical protein